MTAGFGFGSKGSGGSGGSGATLKQEVFLGTGVATTFNCSIVTLNEYASVFLDGVLVSKDLYTISGQDVIFDIAPQDQSEIVVLNTVTVASSNIVEAGTFQGQTLYWDATEQKYKGSTVKRYKALLTQSGTDAPTVVSKSGAVDNVPFENTIGNIVWTRFDAGVYIGTLIGAFTEAKTVLKPISTQFEDYSGDVIYFKFTRLSNDAIQLVSFLLGQPTDELLFNAVIEIEVYE